MKRSLLVCVSSIAAIAVLATSVQAEHKGTRHRTFFEKLFGLKPKKQRRVEQLDPWWDEENPWDDRGVRIIRGGKEKKKRIRKTKVAVAQPAVKIQPVVKKKKIKPVAVATAFVDPEVAEGLGMGNIPYVMPTLVAVTDRPIGQSPMADVAAESVRVVLADRETDIRASQPISKAVLAHYRGADFKPLWMKDGRLTENGQKVLAVMASAAEDGLDANRYLPPVLSDFVGADAQVAGSALAQAQLDVGLTVAAVTYAQHLSGGAYEPERLSGYHDLKSQRVSPEIAIKVLAYSPYPVQYLTSLAPQHAAYRALKEELARADGKTVVVPAAVAEPTFPAGKTVKQGQIDQRIVLLREIFAKENLIQPVVVTEKNRRKLEFLDKALVRVLKKYQTSRGIKATGQLDEATVAVLGGAPLPVAVSAKNRDLLAINMERLRWMPHDLGKRHVLVNQASYTVDVYDNDKIVWESKVIVGKPLNQTVVFSDTFESVVFNPSWGVPQSIILKEYLPKLRADSRYLDKKGFQVVNLKGKKIKSSSINWNTVGSDNVPGVMQPPGGDNALGEVKFLFPNKHAIYMHDTPNRGLFGRDIRNFSHGCVRVENPRKFAEILLGLTTEDVDTRIDSGDSTTLKVNDKIQVHLSYFTAWPDNDGKINYFGDAYERDKTLLNAFESTQKVFAKRRKQQLVEIRKTTFNVKID
jgi:L,D-transpeptidase YcbB